MTQQGKECSAAPGDELDYAEEHPLAAEEWLASRILECFADPHTVCELALVNRNFYAASISDLVWQKMLPPAALLDALLTHFNYKALSKKNLYMYLCKPITYDNGLKKFWLDPATGGDCHMISARALYIAWGSSPEYWEWKSHPHSMFPEVAYLRSVCWFEVKGTFQQLLRPGRYTVSFRMQLRSGEAWRGSPIKLCVQNATYAHPPHQSHVVFDSPVFKIRSCPVSIATSQMPASLNTRSSVYPWGSAIGETHPCDGVFEEGERAESSSLFGRFGVFRRVRRARPAEPQVTTTMLTPSGQREHPISSSDLGIITNSVWGIVTGDNEGFDETNHTSSRRRPPVWVECDAGEFTVEDFNEGRPIQVQFFMKEVEVLWWKGGFTLDGVIIRPSYVVNNGR